MSIAVGLLRAITGKKKPYLCAVILAGGSSSRLGTERTKQMTELCGIPVVMRSALAFEKCADVDGIVFVAKKEEIPLYDEMIKKYSIKKSLCVTAGGATRQESALLGFEKIPDKSDYVAIHDAARCLVTPEIISSVFNTAMIHGAATASQKANDTIKEINAAGKITASPNRESLMLAQTPQIFRDEIYRAASYMAKRDGFQATDDCMLCERLGIDVYTVDCGSENIKITSKTDLALAEVILKNRNGGL